MKGKIAITNPYVGYEYNEEIAQLNSLGFEAKFLPLECTKDATRVIDALQGYDYVLAGPEVYNGIVFDGIGKLKIIARLGTGVENIDIKEATKRGIAVCNAPGSNAQSVSQYVLGFLLDLSLNISKYDRQFRKGIVQRKFTDDLIGKTVGLVGFGNVAQNVAKLLGSFDVAIVAFDPKKDIDAAHNLGVDYVELDELLRRSDYVSIHVPMNKYTEGMVNAEFINKMKETAYLINTSRAKVVNELDLIDALQSGAIAGAAIDVFDTIPPKNKTLLTMENTVVTPYVAYGTKLATENMVKAAQKSIIDYCTGEKIANLMNPEYERYLDN